MRFLLGGERVETDSPPAELDVAFVRLADLLGHPDRSEVGRLDERDDPLSPELGERVVATRNRSLGRVPLAPEGAQDGPADLELEIAFELRPDRVLPTVGVPQEIADSPDEALVVFPK